MLAQLHGRRLGLALQLAADRRDGPRVRGGERAAERARGDEQLQRGEAHGGERVVQRDERLRLHAAQRGLDGLEHGGVPQVERVLLVELRDPHLREHGGGGSPDAWGCGAGASGCREDASGCREDA